MNIHEQEVIVNATALQNLCSALYQKVGVAPRSNCERNSVAKSLYTRKSALRHQMRIRSRNCKS